MKSFQNVGPDSQHLLPAAGRRWLGFVLLLFLVGLQPRGGAAQTLESVAPEPEETLPRIQVLDGRIITGGFQLYRVTGLERDQTLYVHAKVTSGHLDPLVALLKPGVDPAELAGEPLDALVKSLARDHDPIEVTRQILDRYALAGNDDYRGHCYAAFDAVIPADGDYWLVLAAPWCGPRRAAIGSSSESTSPTSCPVAPRRAGRRSSSPVRTRALWNVASCWPPAS
jgi:hypothetical protein